jgi:hypothetical protein
MPRAIGKSKQTPTISPSEFLAAIDPAPDNCGIVLVRGGALLAHHTLDVMATTRWIERYRDVINLLLIEQPPQLRTAQTTVGVRTLCSFWHFCWMAELWSIPVARMTPGAWKPRMKALPVELPEALQDQHQKDAYMLAALYLGKFAHNPHAPQPQEDA